MDGPDNLQPTFVGAGTAAPADPTATQRAGSTDLTVTRSEELLHVATERVVTGRVQVSRYLVTETVTETYQVSHEEIRVKHLPARQPGQQGWPDELPPAGPRELEVILHAERLVVTREVVPVERVTITVATVSEQRDIQETLRREQIELTGVDGAARTLGP